MKNENMKIDFSIEMKDGSKFVIENKYHKRALLMKIKSEALSWGEFADIFADAVEKHWKARTVPTKFSWDESWKDYFAEGEIGKTRFENMAELADAVLYYYIRAFLLGIVLGEMTKGKGKVIALSDDSITAVSNKGFVKKKVRSSSD